VIVSPLSGYPAEKAGLKSKDIIAAVDGQSTDGMSIDSVVKKIRGPENTSVSLTIVRGSGTPFPVSITRTKISVPSVESHIDGNIGYIKVSQFSQDTFPLVQAAAQNFKAKGVKAVVLDLRGDPGGYLESAVNISSLWLDKGKVVVSERKGGKTQNTDYATDTNSLKGMPTAVLIDGGSASASEITAGALHDNGAAILVGAKSFGKGSVQQVINLKDGSELKVTVAHWYTPNGKNINKQGITPDVQVDNADADVKAGKDPQKDKAYEILRSKVPGL
jgi:carboxyl-terminal processing protease